MLNRDFKEFAELLNANGVEYLVVGGCALAAAHGVPLEGFASSGNANASKRDPLP